MAIFGPINTPQIIRKRVDDIFFSYGERIIDTTRLVWGIKIFKNRTFLRTILAALIKNKKNFGREKNLF
ncbi:MAG: hypothetical protein CM15mP58_22090 [Burkholderiaceae bacterium]|nr:MAG: hypothetical protein CM15mP58_22090 [Burkholderiaceae bacterium]